MQISSQKHRLDLPDSLRAKMFAFRRRVWTVKLAEAAFGAAFGVLVAYLLTYTLDRLWDTPAGVRLGIFWGAIAACAMVPVALHRWIWRRRKFEQLALLLSRTYPSVGDQLLGIIELVRSESEQARSLALCEAAVDQVAEQARRHEFSNAVPNPKHRRRAVLAVVAGVAGVLLLALYPLAAANAWVRFLMPWRDTPRYTFAQVDELPDPYVVAHGEPFSLPVTLTEKTAWKPQQGRVQVGAQQPVVAPLAEGKYQFDLPPQIDKAALDVRVGDYTKTLRLEPTLRPELTSVVADVALPEYLGRTKPVKKDVRGGTISLVNGSNVTFTATATRELKSAKVNGEAVDPKGATVVSPSKVVKDNQQVEFQWQDGFGLGGKEPFVLTVNGREDEAPTVACDGLAPRRVVLDLEHLTFKVAARDDYGVKQVGVEWQGTDKANFKKPAAGERILSAGGPEKELLEITGTFCAKDLGIEPQPINVRLFVEDYFPGRPRVYSPTYVMYVLNAEQHAIWLAEQLSKWHRQSLDVRDREMQLYETNKQLRQLPAEELDRPDTRRKIETQAEAERSNGRRLSNLVDSGEDLIQQAMRNPEFGVGHLEKWAAMLQVLKDISGNRMPSVADLLKQSARAQVAKSSPSTKSVGQVRSTPQGGESGDPKEKQAAKNAVPGISDVESSQQPNDPKEKKQAANESKGSPRFSLPVTQLAGGKGGDSCPAGQKMDEAVTRQRDLLAEFDKIADELNRLLANLEGSTLVKRLKAASRLQYRIAGRLGDEMGGAFGVASTATKPAHRDLLKDLSGQEAKSSQDLSNIMDDMSSYFERRRFVQFKTVLDEMRQQDVIGGLRALGDDMAKQNGVSMAQCEYWSDTFDRWAEDLVDPAMGGT